MVVRFGLVLPKFGPVPVAAPQLSPPVARLFCAAGFNRLQSTHEILVAVGPGPIQHARHGFADLRCEPEFRMQAGPWPGRQLRCRR